MNPFFALAVLKEKCKGNEEMYRDLISDLAPKEIDFEWRENYIPLAQYNAPKETDLKIGKVNEVPIYLNIEQAKLLCNKHLVDVNTDLLNQIVKLTKTNKKLYKEKQRLRRRLQELKR